MFKKFIGLYTKITCLIKDIKIINIFRKKSIINIDFWFVKNIEIHFDADVHIFNILLIKL